MHGTCGWFSQKIFSFLFHNTLWQSMCMRLCRSTNKRRHDTQTFSYRVETAILGGGYNLQVKIVYCFASGNLSYPLNHSYRFKWFFLKFVIRLSCFFRVRSGRKRNQNNVEFGTFFVRRSMCEAQKSKRVLNSRLSFQQTKDQ